MSDVFACTDEPTLAQVLEKSWPLFLKIRLLYIKNIESRVSSHKLGIDDEVDIASML